MYFYLVLGISAMNFTLLHEFCYVGKQLDNENGQHVAPAASCALHILV